MRNFLKDKKIVGAMLVSSNVELLDITIPNLMKWCDWALIVMDNETDEVIKKLEYYNKIYYDKMFVRRSSFPCRIIGKNGKSIDYRLRWRTLDGNVRDDVFTNIKKIRELEEEYNNIDILLFPDSDEIFTDYLPNLLEKFVKSDYLAIKTKPIDVVSDMKIIKGKSMSPHVHILKYRDDYRDIPKRYFSMYEPLTPNDCMIAKYYSVHLPYLNKDFLDFRVKNWKGYRPYNEPAWRLKKEVYKMSPEEIEDILKTPPNTLVTL